MIVFHDAIDRLYPNAVARYVSFLGQYVAASIAYGDRALINEEVDDLCLEWRALLNKQPLGDVLELIIPPGSLHTLSGLPASRGGIARGAVRRPWHFERLALACQRCDAQHIRLHRATPIGQISCASKQLVAARCK
jgi:hypothetical protein